MNVANSDTSMLSLTVQATIANGSNETHPYCVGFNNCILGNWVLSNIRNATILNSKLLNAKYKGSNVPMEISHSTVTMRNLVVEGCSAGNSLITLTGSHGSISGSKFARNSAEAMVCALRHSSLTLEGSDFIENTVGVNRGAVVVKSSACEVKNSRFENNTEGAIHVENQAALKISDSYFSGNRAEFGGAILGMTRVEITISNTGFVSNTAGSVPPSLSNLRKQKPTEAPSLSNLPKQKATEAPSLSNLPKQKPTEAPSEVHQHSTTRTPISEEETSPLSISPSKRTQSRAPPTPSEFEKQPEQPSTPLVVSFLSAKHRKVPSVLRTANVSGTMSPSVLNRAFRIHPYTTTPSHVAKPLSSSESYGGAIACVQLCTLTISESSFSGNRAPKFGGAIAAGNNANITVTSSAFRRNSVDMYGGGLAAFFSSRVVITNSSFLMNTATYGGAVAVLEGSTLATKNTYFHDNSAHSHGGAVMLWSDSAAVVKNVTFLQNYAGLSGGGVIVYKKCWLLLINTQFLSNVGEQGGSGLYAQADVYVFVDNSTFTNNTTPQGNGGALYGHHYAHFDLNNSYFFNNSASSIGGALALQINSSADISNVIFYQNGEVAVNVREHCDVRFTRCLFERNEGAIFSVADCTISVSNSQFIQNEAQIDDTGGAITGQFVNVTIYNSTFEGHTSRLVGGALYFKWFTNVTITGCVFKNNSAFLEGSAMFAYQDVNVIMDNCQFIGNRAIKEVGGALSMYGAIKFLMSSCVFEENESGTDGGAIFVNDNSRVVMVNSRLLRNRSGLGGGALVLANSDLEMTNTTFEGNSADAVNGGAIMAGNVGTMTIISSIFANNSALHSGSGGAIYAINRLDLYVDDTTFWGNYADGLGGAVMVDMNASISTKNSRFHYNSDRDSGGALSADRNCTVIAENTTFLGNTADTGACLYLELSNAYFNNCTITDNVASSFGGFADVGTVRLKIAHTILQNNDAPRGRDLFVEKFLSTQSELLTYETLFTHGNLTISSSDKHFKKRALNNSLIYLKDTDITIKETPYASGKEYI